MAASAQKRWLAENAVQDVGSDELYRFNPEAHKQEVAKKGWLKDPQYFRRVKISALATLKMVMHARSGGDLEVMGMLQGKIQGDTMIIIDCFALPVVGTETRVNAGNEAQEYMVNYQTLIAKAGRLENVVGWYHSHPGYKPFLSGIDCGTQEINQKYMEPFLAVVVDPTSTISAGKVVLGAFRMWPEGYTPPEQSSEYQAIPLEKVEDYGVHAKRYYKLDVSYFKSSFDAALLDLLWNKHWASTLSSSPLLANREYFSGQIADISAKLGRSDPQFQSKGFLTGKERKETSESQLEVASRDASQAACEQMQALIGQVVKDVLFNPARPQ
eukprot:TRINITY_DN18988_c0_g1_i1.p1 TRINITY_DN18988_c0_g1~~TRINITY_DN18988_c0_g1_i1.p1  ORF type:complete len:328 (+),score=61.18 TRINITY_DN18988_c0_g1_i1:40-1023(+)